MSSAEAAGRRAAWIGAALAIAFAAPLLLAQPYWQTVDDAFMAMLAHGYGVSPLPSAALGFSSVLYGALIQAAGVAAIAGAQVYGVFTYALLGASAGSAGYALWRAGVGGALAAVALLVVFAPAALYPQFTVVAGLLAVSAVLLLAADGRAPAAALASVLLVLAALVRAEEAVVALLFGLPFLVPALRRAPRPRRFASAATLAVFLVATAASIVADRLYYEAPAWQQFTQMNRVRVAYTDYGLTQYFFREPLDAMRLGWTPNDLVMIEGWFFSDPRVFPPARVAELTSQVSLVGLACSNVKRYSQALAPFKDESFLALLVFAVFAAWRARSRVALWTIAALGAAMVVALVAGRPGITRIYVPPLAGIALFALIAHPVPLRRLHAILLAIGVAVAAAALGARNAADRAEEQEARARLCSMPADRLYVVWGDKLPIEKVYRPLSLPGDGCPLALYPLGAHSYAPFAIERLRAATGASDVVAALLEGREIDMIADSWQVDVLRRHLRIHYRRNLDWRLLGGDGDRGSWYRLRVLPASGQ